MFPLIRTDEAVLSNIFAQLLDPSGLHSQGESFLRVFLELTGLTHRCQGSPRVERESRMTHIAREFRKMDILLDFKDNAVAIENKPWAIEQEEQIGAYVAHLRERYGDDRYIVVYLSGSGEPPTSIDNTEYELLRRTQQLVVVAYNPTLIEWITRCYQVCRAERVRWFLDDVMRYLSTQFAPSRGAV